MKIEDIKYKAKIKGYKYLTYVIHLNLHSSEIEVLVDIRDLKTVIGKSVNNLLKPDFKDIEIMLPYTYFNDKHKERIYEGDILQIEQRSTYRSYPNKIMYFEVKSFKESFGYASGFEAINKEERENHIHDLCNGTDTNKYPFSLGAEQWKNAEIFGNVYEI